MWLVIVRQLATSMFVDVIGDSIVCFNLLMWLYVLFGLDVLIDRSKWFCSAKKVRWQVIFIPVPTCNIVNYHRSPTTATRHSTRKRKAGQAHPPPLPPSPIRTQAQKITEDLLSLFSEVVMLGLVNGEDIETLEMEFACFAANVAKTGKYCLHFF